MTSSPSFCSPPKGLCPFWPCGSMWKNSPKPGSSCMPWPTFTSCTVVMFTTTGCTLATRVAMSGVPLRTGGVAKGAAVCGMASWPFAAEAACWQPVARTRARTGTGMRFRKVMSPVKTTGRAGDSRPSEVYRGTPKLTSGKSSPPAPPRTASMVRTMAS